MWAGIDTPIGHVTNGVHPGTWISPELDELMRDACVRHEAEEWDGIAEPEDLVEEAARTLVEEGKISGRNFGLSIHPWLFGMAHRIRYLDEALTRLRAIDGLWQATTGEIATWARGQLEGR